MGMSRADKREWASATTLNDLGQLMARWLTGDIRSWPGYQPGYGPDDETRDLIPALVAANRAGFLTTCSQPGCDENSRHGRWRQKAGALGHADGRMLQRIRSAAARNGCAVLVDGREEIVTTIDGRPHTGFGGRMPRRDFKATWGGLSRDAYRAIEQAHEVAIVHPEWGPASTRPLIRTLTSLT